MSVQAFSNPIKPATNTRMVSRIARFMPRYPLHNSDSCNRSIGTCTMLQYHQRCKACIQSSSSLPLLSATRLISTALSSSSSSSDDSTTTTTAIKFTDDSFSEMKRQYEDGYELYQSNIKAVPKNIDTILSDYETESSDPSFWDDANKERNLFVTSQISKYSRLQSRIKQWKTNVDDCQVAIEMLDDDDDSYSPEEKQSLFDELIVASTSLKDDSEKYQLELLLSGPYDDLPCRLLITAGAGGTEANDWVADLKRMYERHANHIGFNCQLEDSQAGDIVGYKSVELIISTNPNGSSNGNDGGNDHPYGWFKGEKGAHRLVRLSPFNANNKRQTTFAGVDVAPILNEQDISDIDIPDKDLEITTMRSGGAGGQNVNKVNSAVRIKHLPSGLNVKCTQERSQMLNKELALNRLKGQLLAIAKEQQVEKIQQIRGDQVEASWGAQIRNYVLHPYKLIKDQRSNYETSNTQAFLDGGNVLEDCVASLLQHRAANSDIENSDNDNNNNEEAQEK